MQCYGYSWEAGQSKQVVYQTADHHIHELYVTVGGTWQHADLTAITGAPPAHQIIEGYSWSMGRSKSSKQVVYRTENGHIHELFVVLGGTWQHADLTAITKAPPAWQIRNGYSWKAGKAKQVVYQTVDLHIHELSVVKGGTWQHADLTAITGAPSSQFIGEGYSWEEGQSKQVTFRGGEGLVGPIHELSVVKGGTWQHANLSAITGLPNIFYDSGPYDWGYAWEAGQSKQILFRSSETAGGFGELYMIKGGTWQHADLTAIAGAPPLAFDFDDQSPGYSWKAGQSKQFVYWTADRHIHELYVVKGGTWQHGDLTDITGAPPAKSIRNAYSWEAGKAKQVVYQTDDDHIHELSVIKGGGMAARRLDRHHRCSCRRLECQD